MTDQSLRFDAVLNSTRQRRKDARPQELLDAALRLFVEKGFAATRTDEVAQLAGVSKGTLYLYFSSKEELFKAVVRSNLSSLIQEGMQLAAGFNGPTPELLRLLLNTWWQRVGESAAGGICKIMVAEVRNFPELAQFYLDEVITPANQLIANTLARGIASGEFREVPVREATQALVSPMLFLALNKHSFGCCPAQSEEVAPLQVINTGLDIMLSGLLRSRPQPI